MGIINNIRDIFSRKNMQTPYVQPNEEYEKTKLVEDIIELIHRIKKINTFDGSIWNLSNTSNYELKRKSLAELQRINHSLKNRLAELNKQSEHGSPKEELESSKWTGKKPKDMTSPEFDRFQRD